MKMHLGISINFIVSLVKTFSVGKWVIFLIKFLTMKIGQVRMLGQKYTKIIIPYNSSLFNLSNKYFLNTNETLIIFIPVIFFKY